MNRYLGLALLAGVVVAGCSSQPAGPRLELLKAYPDAEVVGIGRVATVNKLPSYESRLISQKRADELTYPARAVNQGRGIQGCVVVELLVNSDGRVQRTEVAESYPAGYFNQASVREARRFRYPPSGQQMITYHQFVYRIDQSRDSGLEEITRSPGYTELLYLSRIPTDPGIPEGFTGITSRLNEVMPAKCKDIANRYLAPVPPVKQQSEGGEGK